MKTPSPQVQELLDMIRTLIQAIRDGSISVDDAAELCRASSELLLSVRMVLPRWWQRAACQAAANALLEAALHLDQVASSASSPPTPHPEPNS